MTHVKLMWEWGEKFGTEWTSQDSSVREILKLIDCQVEGFKEYLMECMERNGFWNVDCGSFGVCKRAGEWNTYKNFKW